MLTYSSSAVGGRKQEQEGNSSVQPGKWWGGGRGGVQGDREQTSLPTLPPAAHSLPFPGFLLTSFFSGIKEVQKGKLNNPNYRIEKKAHFHVNVTILPQNKHSRNNEALVWICDVEDGHK